MQRKVNRLIRLATSFVILGLVPLLAASTALTGHFRSNMERVVLDDIGRMVSYAPGRYFRLYHNREDA